MALKWGIAAAGKMSHDFANALTTLNVEEHQVVATAARELSRAEKFVQNFGVPRAYGSYLDLAKDPDVEAVYIATLNPQHFEVALLMLENGKHVLCEKPLCLNEKQVDKLITCAEENKLFLMEAIWSRMFPSYQYVRKQIRDGILGDIVSVEAEFGFGALMKMDRVTKEEFRGGSVIDLGVYTIQVCQWAFEHPPKSINATGQLNDYGVDMEMSAELSYGDNKVAKMKTSFINNLGCIAKITGTKGQITIPYFVCPTSIIDVDGSEKSWPLPQAKQKFNLFNGAGLSYEAEETRKCIRAGKIESEHVSHNEMLLFARIEDEIRRQIGVKYTVDD